MLPKHTRMSVKSQKIKTKLSRLFKEKSKVKYNIQFRPTKLAFFSSNRQNFPSSVTLLLCTHAPNVPINTSGKQNQRCSIGQENMD